MAERGRYGGAGNGGGWRGAGRGTFRFGRTPERCAPLFVERTPPTVPCQEPALCARQSPHPGLHPPPHRNGPASGSGGVGEEQDSESPSPLGPPHRNGPASATHYRPTPGSRLVVAGRACRGGEAERTQIFAPHPLLIFFLFVTLVLPGPASRANEPSKEPARADVPEIRFTDVTAAAGISFVHRNGAAGKKYLPETMGGGVAFFDYDSDGDADLLLVQSDAAADAGGGAVCERRKGAFRGRDRGERDRGGGGDGVFGDGGGGGGRRWGRVAGRVSHRGGGEPVAVEPAGAVRGRHGGGGGGRAGGGVEHRRGVLRRRRRRRPRPLRDELRRLVARDRRRTATSGSTASAAPTGCRRTTAARDSLLFRNRGDGRFEEVGAAAGIHVARRRRQPRCRSARGWRWRWRTSTATAWPTSSWPTTRRATSCSTTWEAGASRSRASSSGWPTARTGRAPGRWASTSATWRVMAG